MNRVRLLWVLSIVTVLAVVLVSCAPAATEAPAVEEPAAEEPAEEPTAEPTEEPVAEEPAAAEKVTVTLWLDPPEGGEAADCMADAIVEPFNEQSDTIFVDVTYVPNAWDSVRTALAGGAGPDIIRTPGPSFVYELVQAGQLLALDDLGDEFGWDTQFVPWALSLGEVEGELYSIADEVETLVLYYNTKVFEENGWEPPKTLAEMDVLAEPHIKGE